MCFIPDACECCSAPRAYLLASMASARGPAKVDEDDVWTAGRTRAIWGRQIAANLEELAACRWGEFRLYSIHVKPGEKPMYRSVLIVGLTLAGLSTAQAAGCDDAADQATMNACADKALKASDAELNAVYRTITH